MEFKKGDKLRYSGDVMMSCYDDCVYEMEYAGSKRYIYATVYLNGVKHRNIALAKSKCILIERYEEK